MNATPANCSKCHGDGLIVFIPEVTDFCICSYGERKRFENWYVSVADLNANPVGSRICHFQFSAWQAARAAPSPATPEAEGADAYLIYFEDSERQDEVFLGHGAKEAAEERFADVSDSWNAHLFVCTETNVAAEVNPFKVASPPAAQEHKPVALNYALTPLEQFADGIRAGRSGKLDRATMATALETIIEACQKRLFASPVPASGWVMVPREPTKEMLEAAQSCRLYTEEDGSDWRNSDATWRAMLAAIAVEEAK